MNEPRVVVTLTDRRDVFFAGDVLSGAFQLESVDPDDLKSVEVSVLWHTEGKGDEDLAVHHFERFVPNGRHFGEWLQPRPFRTDLPRSPLSYAGVIVKIHWCVRVRVFFSRNKELVSELPFQLGDVPQAVAIAMPDVAPEIDEAEAPINSDEGA